MLIAIIGGRDISAEVEQQAEEVGRELARRGVGVVCGGEVGVMEAVCRGARRENGLTVGILPGHSALGANPYVQVPIVTGMGYARNNIVVKSGGAVIAIDGSYGTLSEIGIALAEGIPVVGLGTWRVSYPGKEKEQHFVTAATPREAVEKALELAEERIAREPGKRSVAP